MVTRHGLRRQALFTVLAIACGGTGGCLVGTSEAGPMLEIDPSAGSSGGHDSSSGPGYGSTDGDDRGGDTTGSPDIGTSSDDGGSDGESVDGGTETGDTTGDPTQDPPCEEVLLGQVQGTFFTPTPEQPILTLEGGPGAPYRRIELDIDVHIAEFRDDVLPSGQERWTHVMYGLFRAGQPSSWQRYLMGASARVETGAPDRALNHARVDIAQGYMSYVTFKANYVWAEHSDYHFHQSIDADTHVQTLEIYEGGELIKTISGTVDYFEPSLTADGLYLEVGSNDAGEGTELTPLGWSYSNLVACAWR